MIVPHSENGYQDFGVATINGKNHPSRRHHWGSVTWVVVLLLSACGDFGWSDPDTMTPLVETDPLMSPQEISAGEIESAPGSLDNQASSLTTPSPALFPFPIAVPSTRCTSRAIGEDTGTTPATLFPCIGVWVTGWIEACPIFTACESYNIFRWTINGWQHRGFFHSLCVTNVDRSGLPRPINDRIFVGNLDCDQEALYRAEKQSGPLSKGDTGSRVQSLQQRLIELALLDSSADGEFGIKTNNALVDFQYLMGLDPDAIAGPAVFAALGMPYQ